MAKKVLSIAFFISLILMPCAAQDLQEFVVNGGFEAGAPDGTLPESWFQTSLPETTGFVDFIWDSNVKHFSLREIITQAASRVDEKVDRRIFRSSPKSDH